MKFIHRFGYYLGGLLIGSIFVYFIWGKKKVQFDYLPNARVLKDIRTDVRLFSDNASNSMNTIGLDSTDIASILENGEVDFKKSEPRNEPCKKYVIDGITKEKNITLIVKKCDTISTINEILLK
ncbi:DUF4258 domain-containing protein [Urechidicola vernalis]|uniref:DUF4258 domain-containing protein n=1 Tax=Urechidicola vernalis TaxID=3075600 RepID=A0ABU2Y0G4_9FLAO|nr:DUF4258 domain-containing protein [Urechidicola sp. P050]MDT0551647.1 DUF4258 domain-containing protein [Urechidicola sp. P050]